MDNLRPQPVARNVRANSKAPQGAGVEPAASLASSKPVAQQQLVTSVTAASTSFAQGSAAASTSASTSSYSSGQPNPAGVVRTTNPDSVSLALKQLNELQKPVQKRFIQTITVIDPKKLQQLGLDRKIAEALSKQKTVNKQEPNAKLTAPSATAPEPPLDISKLKPAERLAHAKKLLNQKLLAIMPTTSKAAAAATSTSHSVPSSSAPTQNNFYATVKLEKEQPNVYRKLPVLPTKSPQEIARALDFSNMNKESPKLDSNRSQFSHNFNLKQTKKLNKSAFDQLSESNVQQQPQQSETGKKITFIKAQQQPQVVQTHAIQQAKMEQVNEKLDYLGNMKAFDRAKCYVTAQEPPASRESAVIKKPLLQSLGEQAERLSKQSVEKSLTQMHQTQMQMPKEHSEPKPSKRQTSKKKQQQKQPQIPSQSCQVLQQEANRSLELQSHLKVDTESQVKHVPQLAQQPQVNEDSKVKDKPKSKRKPKIKPQLLQKQTQHQAQTSPKSQTSPQKQQHPQPQSQPQPTTEIKSHLTTIKEQLKRQQSSSPQYLSSYSDLARPAQNFQKNNLTYEDIFEQFNSIPKASIRPPVKPKLKEPAGVNRACSQKTSSNFPPMSPLKNTFPTATLPQEAPLPEISTFKKPRPPIQKHIDNPQNISITNLKSMTIKPHPLHLVVLEDKVLTQDEKIDLTLFGLDDSKLETDATSPPSCADPTSVNTRTLVEQSSELPAIGATVSTDPRKGALVVNATQPKKFIIAPDKLKLSKDKIAALAKQIRTQVLQKSSELQNSVPASNNAQSKLQLQTRMSKTGPVLKLEPSSRAVENFYETENKTLETKTVSQQTHPVASSSVITPTLHAAKIETIPKLEEENILRKVEKIIKLEEIKDQISQEPILQNVNALENVTEAENIGNMPLIPLENSLTFAHINSIQPTSQLQQPSINPPAIKQPKIVKIISPKSSDYIQVPKTVIQPKTTVKNIQFSESKFNECSTLSVPVAADKPSTEFTVANDDKPPGKYVNLKASNSMNAAPLAPSFVANKPSSAVRILNDTALDDDSMFSAVDFIASLAASTDFTESLPFELSAEEEKLKATLGMSFSPMKVTTESRRKVDNSSFSSIDATACFKHMLSNDGSSKRIKETVKPPGSSDFVEVKKEPKIEQTEPEDSSVETSNINMDTYAYLSVQNQVLPVHKIHQSSLEQVVKVEKPRDDYREQVDLGAKNTQSTFSCEQIPINNSKGGDKFYTSITPDSNENLQILSNNTTDDNGSSEASKATTIQNHFMHFEISTLSDGKDGDNIQIPVKAVIPNKNVEPETKINELSKKQDRNVETFFIQPKQELYKKPDEAVKAFNNQVEEFVIEKETNIKEPKPTKVYELVQPTQKILSDEQYTQASKLAERQEEIFSKKGNLLDKGPVSKKQESLKKLELLKAQKQKLLEQQQLFNAPANHGNESVLGTDVNPSHSGFSNHIIDDKTVNEVVKVDSQNIQPINADVKNAEEQVKSQKRAPRLKKGKINLVTRKKSVAAKSDISADNSFKSNQSLQLDVLTESDEAKNSSKSHQSLQHEVSTAEVTAIDTTPIQSTTESDENIDRTNQVLNSSRSPQKQQHDGTSVEVAASTIESDERADHNPEELAQVEVVTSEPSVRSNSKNVLEIPRSNVVTFTNENETFHKDPENVINCSARLNHKEKENETCEKIAVSKSLAEQSDDLGLTPYGALEILQGTSLQRKSPVVSSKEPTKIPCLSSNEQKAKEAEAAQILVSLIQPPPLRDEEQPMPEPKIPFKRNSLEEKKSTEKVIGIQNLLKQIEENQLQKPVEVTKGTSSSRETKSVETVVQVTSITENADPNQVQVKLTESTESQLEQTRLPVSKPQDIQDATHSKAHTQPHDLISKILPKETALTAKHTEETKKPNSPAMSIITKEDKVVVETTEATMSDDLSSVVEPSVVNSTVAISNESLATLQSAGTEATVSEKTLAEEIKNVSTSETKTRPLRQKRYSESKPNVIDSSDTANEVKADHLEEKKATKTKTKSILKNNSSQMRSSNSKSTGKEIVNQTEIETVEVTSKTNLLSKPDEGITKEISHQDDAQKISDVVLESEELEKPCQKANKKQTLRSKSKELTCNAEKDSELVEHVSNLVELSGSIKRNLKAFKANVERRRTRSESKTPAADLLASAIVPLAERQAIEEPEDENTQQIVQTHDISAKKMTSCLLEAVANEKGLKSTKKENKAIAVTEGLEKEHKTELTKQGETRQTRRSKSNTLEKDLKTDTEDVKSKTMLVVKEVLSTPTKKAEKSPPTSKKVIENTTSKKVIENTSNLEADKVSSISEVNVEEIVKTSEISTIKSRKGQKRGANTQTTMESVTPTMEDGETVAKKSRKCSLVSFETSFVAQTKNDEPIVAPQEHKKQLEASVTGDHSPEVETLEVKPVLRTYSKRRLESKQSTADTQSDIDITDLDYSTREDSHEETTKEESSQDSRINITSRKRLRKTIDDIKRGRGTEINTDDTDSDDDYNGDCNEFLGFDEFLIREQSAERNTETPIATADIPVEVENHVTQNEYKNVTSCGEKTRSKQIKDWLTTGKAGQPPLPKAIAKKVATTPSAKQTAKSIPLKKRWELVQQRRNIETDITDDTSPAQDDDEEVEKEVPDIKESIQKRQLDEASEKKSNAETIKAKKSKLAEKQEVESPKEHIFAKPQSKQAAPMTNSNENDSETAELNIMIVKSSKTLEEDLLKSNVEEYASESSINEAVNRTQTSPTLLKQRGSKSIKSEINNSPCDDFSTTSGENSDLTLQTALPPQKRSRKSANKIDDDKMSVAIVEETKSENTKMPALTEPLSTTAPDESVNTPLTKKRSRKSKAITTPKEIKEESENALSKTHSTAQEATPDLLLRPKRGRKPKRFFEDFVTEKVKTKTTMPIKTSSCVKTESTFDAEQSHNESLPTTPLNTTAGSRKRGRKPKEPSVTTLDTTASVENTVITDDVVEPQTIIKSLASKRRRQSKTATASQDNSTVMEKVNEPKSIIEIFTSSLSTNPSLKSEKLGAVQKNAANSTDTLGNKEENKLSNKNCEELKPDEESKATSKQITEIASATKKRGRKSMKSKEVEPTNISTAFSDSTAQNDVLTDVTKYNKDSIFPRILLINNREQLDTEEQLTSDCGKPEAGYVKCALCFSNAKRGKWVQHLSEHYGVGWKVGETPVNISTKNTVVAVMIAFIKHTKVKGLNCRLCKRLYRSAIGMISHLETCGISAEEQLKSRVTCEYCSKTYSPLSFQWHERNCAVKLEQIRKDQEAENQTEVVEHDTAPKVLNNVGRVKRNAQMKAEDKLKVIGEELTAEQYTGPVKFVPENHIRYEAPLSIANLEAQCLIDLEKFGKTFCVSKMCRFTGQSFAEFKEHIAKCKIMRKPGYYCTMCKLSKQVFTNRNAAIQHVSKRHGPCKDGKDFDDSGGSDCKIDDAESSSDECSSGVDSTQTDEEDRKADDSDGDDDGQQCKKSTKKSGAPSNRINVRPAIASEKKQLYYWRSRVPSEKPLCERWKQFCKKNFTNKVLFDSGTAKFTIYTESGAHFEELLPCQETSMKFALSTKTNIPNIFGIPEVRDDWQQLKRFETLAYKSDTITFIGGPIKALAWAPLPKMNDSTQYLAICYRKDYDKFTRSFNPKISPMLIVIFRVDMKETRAEAKIQLHYALRIPYGPVHCFEFLPSGGYVPEANRLGLLVVGAASSEMQVYALPLKISDENLTIASGIKTESLRPIVLELKPVFALSLGLCIIQQNNATGTLQCTCIRWSEFHGHSLIIAGFSNGFIGIWDINDSDNDNLNSFLVNDMRHFVPLNYFFTGERGVRDIALHYDSKGLRWLATISFSRNDVIYDLRDLANPMIVRQESPKNVVSAVEWPLMGESVVYSMTDALVNNGNCALLRSLISLGFNSSKIEYMLSAVNKTKFNPYQSVVYSVTDNGDILFHSLRELHCALRRRSLKNSERAIATLDMKCLNGGEIPQAVDKNQTESDYKEKYGLVFGPIITFTTKVDEAFRSSTRLPPFNMRCFTRINCLSCNLNANSSRWTAYGYENGFLRIMYFNDSKYVT